MSENSSPESSAESRDESVISQLLATVERWIRLESIGADASEELAEMRGLARRMMTNESIDNVRR